MRLLFDANLACDFFPTSPSSSPATGRAGILASGPPFQAAPTDISLPVTGCSIRYNRRLGCLPNSLNNWRTCSLARFTYLTSRWPETLPIAPIWTYAKGNGLDIVTADGDDYPPMVQLFGPPPKVILLESCRYPTRIASELMSGNAVLIAEFAKSDQGLLILRL